jgi:hypothetical protein
MRHYKNEQNNILHMKEYIKYKLKIKCQKNIPYKEKCSF